ncbi:MAG: NAD(P)/FAD-dependent oxidoreductase [Clostridia bacterium]|nr:NAD(P)/FAD-dependent oxidoreductase [Clostridia bacterium]
MHTVIIVGGGAAGMFAAYAAANSGNSDRVILIEKNEKLGKKMYITGKGRCNLTNKTPIPEFLNNVISNPKFLYGAITEFSPEKTIDFFENNGCKLKTERGNRVFPVSDKASDVTKTLQNIIVKCGVEIMLNTAVQGIKINDGQVVGVEIESGLVACESVIVCTGGLSYPLTGSTGDGYGFAKKSGHSVVDLKPSLCGLELYGSDFITAQGLSLKNVAISVVADGKIVYKDFGEMLFTHYGVSGPIILSASCIINRVQAAELTLKIDLKPALNEQMLNDRLIREFENGKLKSVANVMRSLLPQSLINVVLSNAKINSEKRCCEILKKERNNLVLTLKNLEFKIKHLRPVDEAIVTAGGVSVKEINPKTMESKLVKGLFFAGEVLDVDAFTGGFNLQIAFSTGFVAGKNA